MKLNADQPQGKTHLKVPIAALRITDNPRELFEEALIEELAKSIRQNGLLNPITVRPPETDAQGNVTYEVIAGGRRVRAHQWLCDHGDDFSMIECCVRTGDIWAMRLIENLQRVDLTPREKENAISQALSEGHSQAEIAAKLSKPLQWVSDIIAGINVRRIADKSGMETDRITTKALSQIRSIPEERIPDAIERIKENGGTVRAASAVLEEFREEKRIEDEKHSFDFGEEPAEGKKLTDMSTFVSTSGEEPEPKIMIWAEFTDEAEADDMVRFLRGKFPTVEWRRRHER